MSSMSSEIKEIKIFLDPQNREQFVSGVKPNQKKESRVTVCSQDAFKELFTPSVKHVYLKGSFSKAEQQQLIDIFKIALENKHQFTVSRIRKFQAPPLIQQFLYDNNLLVNCGPAYEALTAKRHAKIEQRMYPGHSSQAGFLSSDERLAEVYQADKDYLASVGITYEQIADVLVTMSHIYSKFSLGDHKPVEIGEYTISDTSSMGAQECPFKSKKDSMYYGYEYGSIDLTITRSDGHQIVFNTLLPHMIREHHFFEGGKDLVPSHRLEPADVIEMFRMKTDTSYKLPYIVKPGWTSKGGSSEIRKKDLDIANKYALKIYQFPEYPEVDCYLMPFDSIIGGKSIEDSLAETWDEFWLSNKLGYEEKRYASFEADPCLRDLYRQMIAPSSIKPFEQVEEELHDELEKKQKLVEHWASTGKFCHKEYGSLVLYVFNRSSMTDINIEGGSIKAFNGTGMYNACLYRSIAFERGDRFPR